MPGNTDAGRRDGIRGCSVGPQRQSVQEYRGW